MNLDLVSQEAQIQLEKMMRLFNIELVYDDDGKHVRDWQGENIANLASFLGMTPVDIPLRMTMVKAKGIKRLILKRLGQHTMKKIDPATNDFDVLDALTRRLEI